MNANLMLITKLAVRGVKTQNYQLHSLLWLYEITKAKTFNIISGNIT